MTDYKAEWNKAVTDLAMALQADLEGGAAWLNEEAGKKWRKEYPAISEAIHKIFTTDFDISVEELEEDK